MLVIAILCKAGTPAYNLTNDVVYNKNKANQSFFNFLFYTTFLISRV